MKLYEVFSKEQRSKEIALTNPEPSHQTELLKFDESDNKSMDQIISTLQKECSDVLKVYKNVNSLNKHPNKFMYRGERSDVVFFKNSIWSKRKPKFLKQIIHDASVKAFDNLGLSANRENSIFCSKITTAQHWGDYVYVIFPVNGYEITWFDSPKVGEYMYDRLENSIEVFANSLEDFIDYDVLIKYGISPANIDVFIKKYSSISKIFERFVTNIIDQFKPVSNDLERALNSEHNNEYLVTGNAYYGVKDDWIFENSSFFKKLFEGV